MPRSPPRVGPPYGPVERLDVEWRRHLAPDTVIALAASRSYIITMAPDERAAVLAAVLHLLGTHPALAGAAEVVLPYVTRCSRAFLLCDGPVSRAEGRSATGPPPAPRCPGEWPPARTF